MSLLQSFPPKPGLEEESILVHTDVKNRLNFTNIEVAVENQLNPGAKICTDTFLPMGCLNVT